MRMIALQHIPSVVSIVPGQEFIEPDEEQAKQWLRSGHARAIEAAPPRSKRGWDGLIWDGATVCIMASGPSMTIDQAAVVGRWRLASGTDRRTMVINTTYQLAPWADILYACDARWWRVHYEQALGVCPGMDFWSQDIQAAHDGRQVRVIKSKRENGLGREPGIIHQGMSGGYQAINFAYQAGADKIILLGFDSRKDPKKGHHWHGDHPPGLSNNNPYRAWIDAMEPLAADLLREGIEVINCTPGSALRCFPRKKLEEVLI